MVYLEKAPPLKVIAVITIFASTLDLLADILLCDRLMKTVEDFYSQTAVRAAYTYVIFTAVSIVVYAAEMVDVFITLKNEKETPFYSRLAKSMVISLEEVPLPLCLYLIYSNEPRSSLASPALIASLIKLIALLWGVTKFIKLKFCWPFLPCILDHGWRENTRRCFTLVWWRVAMILVNICHLISIVIVIVNVCMTAEGGRKMGSKADDERIAKAAAETLVRFVFW